MPTSYHRFAGSSLDRLSALAQDTLAIGLLVALQLNSVIAPRIGVLDRA